MNIQFIAEWGLTMLTEIHNKVSAKKHEYSNRYQKISDVLVF